LKVAKAAEDILADVRAYVDWRGCGGEGVVFSDIDILIVAKEILGDKKRLYAETLERRSIPMDCLGTLPSSSTWSGEKDLERYMKCLGKRIEIETGQP